MSLPYKGELIRRAKELRKDSTSQEKKLWYQFLCNYPIRFQRQKTIGNYIIDFYCAKAKLAVELDGSQHFTDEGNEYDEKRSTIIKRYGVSVIRFINTDIDRNFEGVCTKINIEVKERLPLSLRDVPLGEGD